jgi:uncharacterized membrane protein YhaH (DUF805 family)
MQLLNLFISFQGRIGRAQFWLANFVFAAVFLVGWLIDHFAQSYYVALAITLLVYLPCAVSAVAVGIKRLQDRNRNRLWLLVFYLVPVLTFALAGLFEGGMIQSVLSSVGLVVSIWALIELGALRGSIGANPYGPDPVAPKPAQH